MKLAVRVSLAIALCVGAAGLAATAHWFDAMAPTRIDRDAPEPRSRAERRVVLVSVDGLAPRVLAATPTPALDRLSREGATASHARTGVPSITVASHVTMLSAVPYSEHRIRWNRYQPWRRIRLRTIFGVCREQGFACGLFAGKLKFVAFAQDEPGVERYVREGDSAAILGAAFDYLRERDPDLVVVHLPNVDWAGHEFGWDSERQRAEVRRIDGLVGAFVRDAEAATQRPLTVIVTADHGGKDRKHGRDIPEHVDIPWLAWGDGVPRGGDLGEVFIGDTAPTLAALLGVDPRDAQLGSAGRPLLPGGR